MLPYFGPACTLLALLSASLPKVRAKEYRAHWVQPSKWYGVDGNWSSIQLLVGDAPAQPADVFVSTVLAESWVIDLQGCPSAQDSQDGHHRCVEARGGIFNRTASMSWNPLGLWSVGLDYLGISANAEYGVDGIGMYTQGTSSAIYKSTAVGAITEVEYHNGFFGLGVIGTGFGQKIALGPIDAMAKVSQILTSRSYGFTAGADYALNGVGSPQSLTIGGYEEKRFHHHDNTFDMAGGLPVLKVRGIEVTKPTMDAVPDHWDSTTELIMKANESVDALIDTTTPHIWLPEQMCDRIALFFNLTWNQDHGYYSYGSSADEGEDMYNRFKQSTDILFKFTLTDRSNHDFFENDRGVVNITVPVAAFTQLMGYPAGGLAYGEKRVPYFTLKRASNSSRVILGRSFMQEAYLKADYDPPRFSIHQVKFPEQYDDISIVTIDGLFPLKEQPAKEGGLPTSALAGIVFAVCAVATAIVVTWYCRRRRRKARKAAAEAEAAITASKDGESDMEAQETTPNSTGRLRSLMSKFKKPKKSQEFDVSTTGKQPVEVAADEDHQRFELPVPIEPVELDAVDTDHLSVNGTTELGTEDTRNVNAYEIARRKLERQLQGPVPAYTPPAEGSMSMLPAEKSDHDVSIAGHYRPSDNPSPINTPTAGTMPPPSIPSPMTPHPDWPARKVDRDLPSPMTVGPPLPSPTITNSASNPSSTYTLSQQTYPPSSISRTNSTRSMPRSPLSTRRAQPPSLPSLIETQSLPRQRTPGSSGPSPTSPKSANSAGTPQSGHFPKSPLSRLGNNSADISPVEGPPTPAIQRTPIDSSHVVCLGPLPAGIQLPGPGTHQPPSTVASSIPRVVGPDGRDVVSPTHPVSPMRNPEENRSVDTLGSNFTELEEAAGQPSHQPPSNNEPANNTVSPLSSPGPTIPPTVPPTAAEAVAAATARRERRPPAILTGLTPLRLQRDERERDESPEGAGDTPKSPMRIEGGVDLVHVPQVAERRYSWEDDRS